MIPKASPPVVKRLSAMIKMIILLIPNKASRYDISSSGKKTCYDKTKQGYQENQIKIFTRFIIYLLATFKKSGIYGNDSNWCHRPLLEQTLE